MEVKCGLKYLKKKMQTESVEILKRALEREKASRKAAEKILEEKSTSLYEITNQLEQSNKRLEKLLQLKISELDQIFQTVIDAYVVMELSGEVITMNKAAKELLGYDIDKESINLFHLVKGEYHQYTLNTFYELFIHGKFNNYKAVIVSKDRKEKIVQVNASIIYDDLGHPIAAQGIVRDITNDISTTQNLINSEERLSTLISSLHIGVLMEDENCNIILTNQEFCEMFSIEESPESLIGKHCNEAAEGMKKLLVQPDNLVTNLDSLMNGKTPVFGDELLLKSGKIYTRDYIPIHSKGEFRGHLWSYTDVTAERNYGARLEAEKEKYSRIINNMNLGLMELDNEGYIQFVNNSFCEKSLYSREELLNKRAEDIFLKSQGQDYGKHLRERRQQGITDSYEIKVKIKNNETRHWLLSGTPNIDIDGKITGSIGIYLDITNQKELELQRESLLKDLEERNERLNEYAHIVSHDLKSPLRNISALVSWTKEDVKAKSWDESLRNLDLMQQRVEKMDRLIENILQYSSIGQSLIKKEEINLNELIREIVDILYIPPHISIAIKKELPIIKADTTQIQQVFLNLVGNAVNYLDKEVGKIEIDYTQEDNQYTFYVKDNGVGIEKKNQEKIFTIFKSLGTHENSTGIGLSIVKKIIDFYEGRIWVESELGVGSTFCFTLPKI